MPQPKVIIQLYPMIPAEDRADRERKRPIGRDSALYHKVVHEWMDIVKAADEMGVWGISTIEHHLHSEGYEVGPNPGILNAWWAGNVKNAWLGALGYVMATQDPIRVAEETAILDHITNGKFFCGLARGYQSRWANILGQFSDSVATVSDGSANDIRNRDIFEERTRMLIECWTKDSIELNGNYYKAPYPYDTGVRGYPAWPSAKDAGCLGEIDDAGNVRRISVVPPPFQTPHPPIFVAVSSSADSIRFCARNGLRPTYFTKLDKTVEFSHLYHEQAAKAGLNFAYGERQNIVRWIHVARDGKDYDRKLERYDLDIYKNFYTAFFPQMAGVKDIDWLQSIKDSGIFVGGTLDELKRGWEQTYEQIPAEFITLIWHYAQCPKDEVLYELETFMTKVLPNLEAPTSNRSVLIGGRV